MLQRIKTYHDHLVIEAARAGRFRLPMMGLRMLLCQTPIAAIAVLAAVMGLNEGARWAVVLPIGCVSIAAMLHLGYVFTEGFEKAPEQ